MKEPTKNRRTIQAVVLFTFIVLFVSPVCAGTISFEGVVQAGGISIPVTPYSEAGFGLTNAGFFVIDGIFSATSGVNNNGTDIFGWCGSCGPTPSILTLTANDSSPFSIQSLDATNLVPGSYSTGMGLMVTGFLNGGGSVTQNLEFIQDTFTTFQFDSGFANLVSLQIQSSLAVGADLAMDNLVVTAVPELSTMFLLSAGLAVMAVLGRRKLKE